MEWLKNILSGIAGGKTAEEIEREISTELPKHYKPAKDFNERGQTIEDLKKEVDTLKRSKEDIQTEYDNFKKGAISQADYESKVSEIETNAAKTLAAEKVNNAIDIALLNAGTRNVKATKALLNLENVKLDGTNLIGLNDQLEALKKSDTYLFNMPTTVNRSGSSKDGGRPGENDDDIDYDNMSDEEYFAAMNKK